MRRFAMMSAVLVAACGPGRHNMALEEPAPGPPACIENVPDDYLTNFAADDKVAVFCLHGDQSVAGPRCFSVDLASGVYRSVPLPPPAQQTVASTITVDQVETGSNVCTPDGCTTIELPADFEGACLESAWPVGGTIYVATSNCAGPGGGALLYNRAGTLIRGLANEGTINVYGATPIPVGGANWAVVSYDGGDVLIFSAASGKQVHLVDIPRDDDCTACGEVLGTPAFWRESPIVKTASGKLVTLGSSGIAVIDPATGAIEKTHPLAICPSET